MKPLCPILRELERLGGSDMPIGVQEAHECLVDRIVRGPDLTPGGDALEVFLRDRAEPLAAVRLLAEREAVDDGLGLAPYLAITRRGGVHRGGGKPMAEEVAAQLAGGRLPSPMDALGLPGLGPEAGLLPVGPEEVVAREPEHVGAVGLALLQQFGIAQLYIGRGRSVQTWSSYGLLATT